MIRNHSFGAGGPATACTSSSHPHSSRFVISIDYGTDNTKAAWVQVRDSEPLRPGEIHVVQNWPGCSGPFVPSVYAYTGSLGEEYGSAAAASPQAIRHTKLELEPADRSNLLDELCDILNNAATLEAEPSSLIPRHITKSSSAILTDYLEKVLLCIRAAIDAEYDSEQLGHSQIDFVITQPANWTYNAKNIELRAISVCIEKVFPALNGSSTSRTIHLMPESEACAYSVLTAARESHSYHLSEGQCFLILDAGASKIEVACYLVAETIPMIRLRRVTPVSSDSVGSICVDNCLFQHVLNQTLYNGEYGNRKTTSSESEPHVSTASRIWIPEREAVLKQFQDIKYGFDDKVELEAKPLATIQLPQQFNQGETSSDDTTFAITQKDMLEFFKAPINGAQRLIDEQFAHLQQLNLVLEGIFVSGGLASNAVFFRRVQEVAQKKKIVAFRSEDDWDTVAKGAILNVCQSDLDATSAQIPVCIDCSPSSNSNITSMCIPSPYHIGVVMSDIFDENRHHPQQRYQDMYDGVSRAKDTVWWIIAKGDLIPPQNGMKKKTTIFKRLSRASRKTGTVTIAMSKAGLEGSASRFNGRDDNTLTLNLDYDITKAPKYLLEKVSTNAETTYYRLEMQLVFTLDQRNLTAELYCEDNGLLVAFTGLRSLSTRQELHSLGRVSVPLFRRLAE